MFDVREELHRAVKGLELTIIRSVNSINIINSKGEAKIAKQQLDRTLA